MKILKRFKTGRSFVEKNQPTWNQSEYFELQSLT